MIKTLTMKYELIENKIKTENRTLYQIKALKDFSDVKSGDLGGWIEKESNLSQEGNAWVNGDAWIKYSITLILKLIKGMKL